MVTLEELSIKVKEAFKGDSIALKEWSGIEGEMRPHYEDVPCSDWYTDEYGNEIQDYEAQLVEGCASTYEDDIAYFCWKCGCNLGFTQDYWDGSETYYISLPRTEEEYRKNLNEANQYWKEVIG